MNSHRVVLLSACLMLSAMMLAGCGSSGPAVAPTTGTVTYNGKPVEGANVTFISVADPSAVANGVTDAQGKFTAEIAGKPGAPIGKNNVGIAKGKTAIGTMSAEEAKKMTMAPADPAKMKDAKAESELPLKYASPAASGLTQTVEAGKPNNFTFDLTDGKSAGAAEKTAK